MTSWSQTARTALTTRKLWTNRKGRKGYDAGAVTGKEHSDQATDIPILQMFEY